MSEILNIDEIKNKGVKMKKIMLAAFTAGVLANSGFANEIGQVITTGDDGKSIIYIEYNKLGNSDDFLNRSSCVYITQHNTNGPDDLNTINQNTGTAMQHSVCQLVANNGVTFTVNNNLAAVEFPISIQGLNVDFSKSLARDSLKKLEKISVQTKENNVILFIKWLTDRSFKISGSDTVGQFYSSGESQKLGTEAIYAAYYVQGLVNNGEHQKLEELIATFSNDIAKGWNALERISSIRTKIYSNPSWYECRDDGNGNVKAIKEVDNEQLINFSKSMKLYSSLDIKKYFSKTVKSGDLSTGNFLFDPLVFDNRSSVNLAYMNETIVQSDPSVLWLGMKTFANIPERCANLQPLNLPGTGKLFYIDAKLSEKKQYESGRWYFNPSTKCKTVLDGGFLASLYRYKNVENGKEMTNIRGVNMKEQGLIAFGDGIAPRDFYVDINSQNAYATCLDISKNGVKINDKIYKIRSETEVKIDTTKVANDKIKKVFEDGVLWVSDYKDGTCHQMMQQQVETIVDRKGNCKTAWFYDNEDHFAGRGYAIKNKGLFSSGYTHYDFKDCLHSNSIKDENGKWQEIFFATSQAQCEAAAKDNKILSGADFKAKYTIERN